MSAGRPTKRPRGGVDIFAMTSAIQENEQNTASSQQAPSVQGAASAVPVGVELGQALFHYLWQVRKKLLTYPAEQRQRVEVEARIGLAMDPSGSQRFFPNADGKRAVDLANESHNFSPGVSLSKFRSIETTLATALADSAQPSVHGGPSKLHRETLVEKVYLCGDRRVVQRIEPRLEERCETKEKLLHPDDIALPSAPYDVRVSVVDERPMDVPPNFISTAQGERHKTRTSYTSAGPGYDLWQIDLTQVAGTGDTQDSYEVEFELTQPGMQLLSQEFPSDQEASNTLSSIAKRLENWVMLVNPIDVAKDPTPPALASPDATRAAAMVCDELVGMLRSHNNFHSASFPGAMPVNMCKHHIPKIQSQQEYFVTEKTDGVRQLLVSVALPEGGGNTCVLVDRKMTTRQLPGGDSVGFPVGTVLDGEVVYNMTLKKPVYLVFDVLRYGDLPLVRHTFLERVRHLARPEAKQVVDRSAQSSVPVCVKKFFKREQTNRVFQRVASHGEEHVYRTSDGSSVPLHHRTDGVIFQPNTPYSLGTDRQLLKWKYLDTVTVDMEVTIEDGSYRFSCKGSGGLSVDFSDHIHLEMQDLARLKADLAGHAHAIVELGLDVVVGTWFYKCLRPDKDRANHLNTVIQTLLELSENVSSEELQYRMFAKTPAQDDWEKQRSKMARQALEFASRRAADSQHR